LKEADEKGVKGALITPFLLKRVNELTGGESSASSNFPFFIILLDVELIKNNAKLGAEIAVSLAQKLAEESKSAENH
jgi:pseudouridine-5'-phosphate glycosidase